MREKLIELLKKADRNASDKFITDYNDAIADNAEFLLANGVIASTVNVGDTVYYIKGGYYAEPKFCKVSRPCKVVEVSLKLQRNRERVMQGFITDNGTRYGFDSIGKTVFLTREDAEKALAERSKS